MNEQQFNKKGKLYHSARPAYSEALFQTLREQIPPQSVVADIGSGTRYLFCPAAHRRSKSVCRRAQRKYARRRGRSARFPAVFLGSGQRRSNLPALRLRRLRHGCPSVPPV